jgi:exopolyphosphatase/guanosine-5'-triphosphate,3'-diphosphate pyrophosphatase
MLTGRQLGQTVEIGQTLKIGQTFEILDDAYSIARMGKGVDAHQRISQEAIQRVCATLKIYCRQAETLGSEQILVFGTSALRDAANKNEVIAQVKSQVGLDLQELSGLEEARLTYQGAGYGLDLPTTHAVLDIGGGSTEWALGRNETLEFAQSLDIGSVRLSERFFPQLPPQPKQIQHATEFIREALSQLPALTNPVPVVGVAGTVTTLGAIDMGATDFNADVLNGHFLDRTSIHALSSGLLAASLEETAAISQIPAQRADIIAAGALILRTIVEHFALPGVLVSTRGIRYALLAMMFATDRL